MKLTGALERRLAALARQVDLYLEEAVLPALRKQSPAVLTEPMAYSLLSPGKRLRPALLLACAGFADGAPQSTAEIPQRCWQRALGAASALEAIHAYSLIHDDLPAMDDDDLRRGRPTCHRQFNEWAAILAGDAWNTMAFELLLGAFSPEEAALACRSAIILARAAGPAGMAGGQALDLANEDHGAAAGSLDDLEKIHKLKTAALIAASCEIGALLAAQDASPYRQLGEGLGLLFQIADDLLDRTGDSAAMGKRAGKDQERGKLTYPALLGLEAARQRAEQLQLLLAAQAQALPWDSEQLIDPRAFLAELCSFILQRER
ncbi:MAG: polyprenyl synthetase family protein [Leptospirales bacterium]|nr:polyprenyl synthetase family protein [Leptospirales bacterium]